MKKLGFKGLLVVFMTLSAKNKLVTDYRDSYVGNYTCSRTFKHVNDAGTALVSDVSTYTLSVQKASTDSFMIVGTKEDTFTFKLITPHLVNTEDTRRTWGSFFASDSIFVNFIPGHGPFGYFYIGKKN